MKILSHLTLFTLTLAGIASPVQAALAKADFLAINDGLLVIDSVTNLEWLTPVHTRGQPYNNAIVQGIIAEHGFRYATAPEVISMIDSNFGNPTRTAPGDAAGFAAAGQFFALFGVTENVFCAGGPCPRTQGLTSTPGSSGAHLGFGMIQLGPTGWFIVNNNWPNNVVDPQMGSFLIRDHVVPEPGTMAGMALGLIAIAWRMRRC